MRNLRVQLLLSHLLLVVLFGAAISVQVRQYFHLGDSLERAVEVARRNGPPIQDVGRSVHQQIADMTAITLWEVCSTLIVAVTLAYVIVGLVLKPVLQFARQAESIGQGNFSERVPVNRNDEIGVLATAFNTMSDRLDHLRRLEMDRVERAEQTTHLALTFLYDPVIVTDAEGRIVFLNRAAEQIWGPTPETPCLPVVNEPYDLRVIQAIHKAVRDGLATGAGPEAPSVAINVAGVPKSFQLHVSPLRNEDGVNLGCVAVLQDVTHLKEVDRLKTEFIGVASHELRSPIQSLLLSAQLLEEGAQTLTAAQRDLVETQLKDLNRLDRLAGNLLDISKLEAGAAPPKLEAILPGEVLKSAAESLRFKAAAKSVTINLEESPNLPPVQADRSQIQQVLHNLADNAIRHSPVGGVVSLRAFSTGNRVTFLIEDNGEGIPPEYLKAILERFVQVPGATSGGAGLGLSIAQTLLNGHGAELRVQSEAGKGSSFSFELEAANSPAGKESI